MSSLQFWFLFTSSLLAFVAVLFGTRGRDVSHTLVGYFAISAATAGLVLFGVWPWDGETYLHSTVARAVYTAAFAVECGWELGLSRRLWRETLFRGCCLALASGVGAKILEYLPRGETGWGLRALIGLHFGVAGVLSEVGRHEALSDFRQTAVRWLFIVAIADAINLAAVEGPLRDFADWLGVMAWIGLCLMVSISAFDATLSSPPAQRPFRQQP